MKNFVLYGIQYSPWTERARWALDHHQIAYRYKEHLIWMGMPELRIASGQWTGDLTVPLLINKKENGIVMDSFRIATYADQIGTGSKLVEGIRPEEMAEVVADAEAAADAVRARLLDYVLNSKEAQLGWQPKWVPVFLRGLMKPLVRHGANYIRRSFDVDRASIAEHKQTLRGALQRLRWRLSNSEFTYVLGKRFSFADIAACSVINGVFPPGKEYMRISKSARAAMHDEEFVKDFSDLIQWRDRTYAKHRRIPTNP